MEFLDLPVELFRLVLEMALLKNGLQQVMSLRLVCKTFDKEVIRAVCVTKALERPDETGMPCGRGIWREYHLTRLLRRDYADPFATNWHELFKTQAYVEDPGDPILRIVRETVDYIIQQRPQDECCRVAYTRSLLEAAETSWVPYQKIREAKMRPHRFVRPWEGCNVIQNAAAAAAYLGLGSLLDQLIQADLLHERHATNADGTFEVMHSTDFSCGVLTCFGYPIVCAAKRSDIHMVRALLQKYSADHPGRKYVYTLPFIAAAGNGNEEMIRLFASPEFNTGLDARSYRSAMSQAAINGRLDTVLLLLELADRADYIQKINHGLQIVPQTDKNLQSFLLINAAWAGQEEIVLWALEQGAATNPYMRWIDRRNALECAVFNGHTKLVELLLSLGFDPRAGGGHIPDNECRALNYAAKFGFVRIAEMLLKYGANVDAAGDARVKPPLVAAVQCGHVDMVKLLLENGASIHCSGGCSLYQLAALRGFTSIMRLLEEHGAEKTALDEENSQWQRLGMFPFRDDRYERY